MENDLNDNKESRRIRQYKYNLTANGDRDMWMGFRKNFIH